MHVWVWGDWRPICEEILLAASILLREQIQDILDALLGINKTEQDGKLLDGI